ncbi:hypothetical protein JB92DRAFT_3210160 [Gautieria morchelliformis]|nr:hypothetical protein JB92DRAFT_3210160 [Gautieria morchelliformis]
MTPVSDQKQGSGAFSSLTKRDVLQWLKLLGVNTLGPSVSEAVEKNGKEQKQVLITKLRLALCDVQRLDLLFPGYVYGESPNMKLGNLPSWPNWHDARPELRFTSTGPQKVDGYADAARIDSYVMRHFSTMAFTQQENIQVTPMNAAKDITGAWIGTKQIMAKASLDITREGGKDTPFVIYYAEGKQPATSALIMEIMEVKQASWPEPGPKFLREIKMAQERKFGNSSDGPLNPMMQTPKVPVVVVRYSYIEGTRAIREGGSQFTRYLESRLKETMPPNTSAAALRNKLMFHLKCGETIPEEHIRMFARLLSHNAGLVDCEWRDDLQSHWFLPKEVEQETNISFFVPCPRLRFRALEEIETGKPPTPFNRCSTCGKDGSKSVCGSCKAACYCDLQCSKAGWPKHKAVCKFSKKILDDPASLPSNKFLIPARAYFSWSLDFGFANEQEIVKMGSGTVYESPRNEYGDERFVCFAILRLVGPSISITMFDRRRSVLVMAGHTEHRAAMEAGITIPFDKEGYSKFVKLIQKKGHGFQLLYVWVKRVGDCLEVDLEDVPNQSEYSWAC